MRHSHSSYDNDASLKDSAWLKETLAPRSSPCYYYWLCNKSVVLDFRAVEEFFRDESVELEYLIENNDGAFRMSI